MDIRNGQCLRWRAFRSQSHLFHTLRGAEIFYKFTFIVISSMALVFLFLIPSSSVWVQIYRPLQATSFTRETGSRNCFEWFHTNTFSSFRAPPYYNRVTTIRCSQCRKKFTHTQRDRHSAHCAEEEAGGAVQITFRRWCWWCAQKIDNIHFKWYYFYPFRNIAQELTLSEGYIL